MTRLARRLQVLLRVHLSAVNGDGRCLCRGRSEVLRLIAVMATTRRGRFLGLAKMRFESVKDILLLGFEGSLST